MVMPAARTEWTVDMLDDLPEDGNRYEVIDGELFVTPAPSDVHQLIVTELVARLHFYLQRSVVARVLTSPSDVRRPDRERNRVQPDVFVVKLTDGRRPPYPFDLTDLVLVVEVVSPNHSQYDYQTKRELYLPNGVVEYWIVDPEARTFARWRDATDRGELLTETIMWQPDGLDSPLVIDVPRFFDDALG